MPVIELASASLKDDEFHSASEGRSIGMASSSGGSSSDFSSTKGRLGGRGYAYQQTNSEP